MDNQLEKQERVLARLYEMLTKRLVASRLVDEGKRLTVYLPELVPGADIYGDIYYPPVEESLGNICLCAMEFELMDASGLSEEHLADLLAGAAMMNAAIPLGGFGVETTEGEAPVGSLVFRQALPLLSSLSEERLYEAAETAFFAMAAVMTETVSDLIALSKGELSRDEFLEKL